jgi:hypothetical protein
MTLLGGLLHLIRQSTVILYGDLYLQKYTMSQSIVEIPITDVSLIQYIIVGLLMGNLASVGLLGKFE